MATSTYSPYEGAQEAVRNLTTAFGTGLGGMDTSAFDAAYNPFNFVTDQKAIQNLLDNATIAAYDQQIRDAQQASNATEDQTYASTRDAISQMRRALAGSASSGGNVGAAGATALQALLGLGQQNSTLATEALQNVQNIFGERSAALAGNAASAFEQAEANKAQQANVATSKYGSEGQRAYNATTALATLVGALDTNMASERMNNATNSTNREIAETPTTSYVYNRSKKG